MRARTALRLLVGFGISAFLLVLVLRGIDRDALLAAFAQVDWRWLPLAIVLYFVGAWLRSIRWKLLLPEFDVPVSTLFSALVVGFTVNNLLPVRMGEIARAYLLARWDSVPYGATLASLVVERVLDGLSLALLLLVGISLVSNPPEYLVRASLLVAAVFVVCGAILVIASWRAGFLVTLAERLARPLPRRAQDVVGKLAVSFARALSLVRGKRRLLSVVLLSLLAWCFELSLFLVLMPSLGIAPSVPVAFLVGAAANFATLVPSAPGYVGTFEAALTTVLRDTAAIEQELALAYALVVHATLFLPVVLVGTLVLWRSNLSMGQIARARERVPAGPAGGDLQAVA